MGGGDRSLLEARLLADLLAHVDGRAVEFDQRLVALEGRCGDAWTRRVGAMGDTREEAESLYRDIRRLSAAVALAQAYMQVRRQQLAELRAAAARDDLTTMEVSDG
jgi:hypothetical protein